MIGPKLIGLLIVGEKLMLLQLVMKLVCPALASGERLLGGFDCDIHVTERGRSSITSRALCAV
jgi:hypothetical protein